MDQMSDINDNQYNSDTLWKRFLKLLNITESVKWSDRSHVYTSVLSIAKCLNYGIVLYVDVGFNVCKIQNWQFIRRATDFNMCELALLYYFLSISLTPFEPWSRAFINNLIS